MTLINLVLFCIFTLIFIIAVSINGLVWILILFIYAYMRLKKYYK